MFKKISILNIGLISIFILTILLIITSYLYDKKVLIRDRLIYDKDILPLINFIENNPTFTEYDTSIDIKSLNLDEEKTKDLLKITNNTNVSLISNLKKYDLIVTRYKKQTDYRTYNCWYFYNKGLFKDDYTSSRHILNGYIDKFYGIDGYYEISSRLVKINDDYSKICEYSLTSSKFILNLIYRLI